MDVAAAPDPPLVGSLNKYLPDLRLTKSDIICLTGTQLTPKADVPEIVTLQGFEVAYNNSQDGSKVLLVRITHHTHIYKFSYYTNCCIFHKC